MAKEITERTEIITKQLKEFVDKIASLDENRMSAMLSPEVVLCDEEQRETQILFKMKDWEKNQRDEIHGGAIAAMFDTAMGSTAAVFDRTGEVTTVDLHVSYIRPFVEETYLFVSEVIHPGRTLSRVEGKAVACKTGKVAATCTATFCPYKK